MIDARKHAGAACLILLCGLAPLGGHGAGGDKAKPAYEYHKDTARVVGMLRLGAVSHGRLDAAGNFLPDEDLTPPVLNKPLKAKEPVYEYRSGSLIKGTLRDDGVFVPDLGSKVLTLKEYLAGYDPKRPPRVYNLPGRIVEKGEAPDKSGK